MELLNNEGDFSLNLNRVKRWKTNDKVFYYAGLQMINIRYIIKIINLTKFSFNKVWDFQIKKKKLYGNIMSSNWYHVGNKKGFKEAKNSLT